MGFQQTLYIALGVIIIGVTIAVTISFAGKQNNSPARDALTQDCVRFAAEARVYYQKPAIFGGGHNSFDDIDFAAIGFTDSENENGTFTIKGYGDECVIVGYSCFNPGATITVTVSRDGSFETQGDGW